jgi:hypothetical protein
MIILIIFYQIILPSQANPSPLYPVLHVQIKLPSVLSQAAFLSQGLDTHSSISIKCQKIDVNAGMTVEPILKKKIVEYFYWSNHYTALFFILKYVLMDATSGAGTAYPSRAPEFTPGATISVVTSCILITGSRYTFINIYKMSENRC